MKILPLVVTTIALSFCSIANADMIEYENKYSDEVPFIDLGSSYANVFDYDQKKKKIYSDSPEVRNNS